jgi:effector-binding domain-containing protein
VYDITIEDQDAQNWLTLSESLPRDQVPGFLGEAYPTLFAALGAAAVAPAGPPVARYHVDKRAFEVTAAVPFSGELSATLPLVVQTVPATTVATTVHTGSYEDLPAAFHAVMQWISANGFVIAADPWESYLDGPEVAAPRTKVCFPVTAA